MRIALDAMGGDHGPEMLIQGAIAAVEEQKDLVVILVGPDSLHGQLAGAVTGKPGDIADRLKIQHAPEVVGMDESPVDAVRKKKTPLLWWVLI